jgi:hypothetical protein
MLALYTKINSISKIEHKLFLNVKIVGKMNFCSQCLASIFNLIPNLGLMPNVYDFMNNFHIIKLYFPFIETSYDLLVQPINYISFQRLFFLKPCEMTFFYYQPITLFTSI